MFFGKDENLNSLENGNLRGAQRHRGFTLFELVVTMAVLSIFVMGTIPLVQNGVRRDKEIRLRETLRQVRAAIDEFKRDTLGACPAGAISTGNPTQPQPAGADVPSDPRSRVVIDDCKIFDSQNIDFYPPTLDTLVSGVKVRQRGLNLRGGGGLGESKKDQATEINSEANEPVKVYLRELPVDPMTGKSDWKIRSSYQGRDEESWDEINVFDIRSASDGEALNGEKYSDW